MAAPQNAPRTSTPLLHSRNKRSHVNRSTLSRLPTGPCNFTNLSIGGTARCGCQGFWDRSKYEGSQPGRQDSQTSRDICMCDHHACYHDFQGSRDSTTPEIVVDNASQQSSQLLRVQDLSLPSTYHDSPQVRKRIPLEQRNVTALHPQQDIDNQSSDSILSQVQRLGAEQGSVHSRGSEYLRGSNNRPPSHQGLPPIPSQCLLPPDISSGGIEGESQSLLSFGSYDFNKSRLTNGQAKKSEVESFNQSATEVVTPSPQGSPDLGTTSKFDRQVTNIKTVTETLAVDGPSDGHNKFGRTKQSDTAAQGSVSKGVVAIRQAPDVDPAPLDMLDIEEAVDPLGQQFLPPQMVHQQLVMQPSLEEKIRNHQQRLDLLENASYSNAALEEVHEKFELFDDRIIEVENKVEELEKAQAAMNDNSSVESHRRVLQQLHDVNSSMSSQTSSAMISAAIGRAELMTRIQTLETQLSSLHASALPSSSNPWEMEVVFLPFGVSLRGIWSPLNQFPSQRSRRSSMEFDDWTQTQFSTVTKTRPNTDNLNTSWEQLQDESDDINNWLVAKACGPGSKVEDRLRSRGLVKKIAVKGADARDVQAAMLVAFGTLPKVLATPSPPKKSSSEIPEHLRAYHGLHAPWIPLRKIHKDSRLRYLDPSELVTPALWTAVFLSSSVAMRATGVKRLYVTQRDSYIQHGSEHADWTWQRLRELPRVYPDTDSPGTGFHGTEVREADAREACWEWDERLDPPPSLHSSFLSHHSSLSIRGPPQEDERTRSSRRSAQSSSVGPSPIASTTPTSIVPGGRAVSPLTERQLPRPLHFRTTSMPSMLHLHHAHSASSSQAGGPTSNSAGFVGATGSGSGKRRIASFDQEPRSHRHHTSPPPPLTLRTVPSSSMANKRQRTSRSPSRPRDTPRWSVGPPSPYFIEEQLPMDQKRGVTPLAYATPFSNAPTYYNHNEWNSRARSVGTPGLGIDFDLGNNEVEEERGSTTDEDAHIDPDAGHVGVFEDDDEGINHEESGFDIHDDDVEDGFEDDREHQLEHGYPQQQDDEIWEGMDDDEHDSGHAQVLQDGSLETSLSHSGMEHRALSLSRSLSAEHPSQIHLEHNDEDEENRDPDDELMSDASSGPSEYPSTQPQPQGMYAGGRGHFVIHIDDGDEVA